MTVKVKLTRIEAEFDGYGIWLTTDNPNLGDKIYLHPWELVKLVSFYEKMTGRPLSRTEKFEKEED